MKSINEFKVKKNNGNQIALVTCYDYWSASIIEQTDIDAVLVGDSAAMVMHGYKTTINADVNMMSYHISAVTRGISTKIIIADFPFLAHRKGLKEIMDTVDIFMKLGANAIKIEGAGSNIETITHIVESGVPVMGHIGLTPQSVNSFGGFLVQGKDEKSSERLIKEAIELQNAGCFSIVLELIPAKLSKKITELLEVPTIGIGAGPYTSGQILVLQDMLGLTGDFNPKFLRKYLNGFELIKNAVNRFNSDVKANLFPNEDESF